MDESDLLGAAVGFVEDAEVAEALAVDLVVGLVGAAGAVVDDEEEGEDEANSSLSWKTRLDSALLSARARFIEFKDS